MVKPVLAPRAGKHVVFGRVVEGLDVLERIGGQLTLLRTLAVSERLACSNALRFSRAGASAQPPAEVCSFPGRSGFPR